jgi:hypothetical protein
MILLGRMLYDLIENKNNKSMLYDLMLYDLMKIKTIRSRNPETKRVWSY